MNDELIDFVNRLIDKHKGIENALIFAKNKVDELNKSFHFKFGEPMDGESIKFWVSVVNELEFKIEMN